MSLQTVFTKVLVWFDNSNVKIADNVSEAIDWMRVIPFILMHLVCLLVFVVGWSPVALWVALGILSAAHVRHYGFLSSLFFP